MTGDKHAKDGGIHPEQGATLKAYLGVAMVRGSTISEGHGAWGAVLHLTSEQGDAEEVQMSGRIGWTTTNRAWLVAAQAVMARIKLLGIQRPVLVSGSEYLVNNAQHRTLFNWYTNDWVRLTGQPVANVDEWKPIYELVRELSPTFQRPFSPMEVALCQRAKTLGVAVLQSATDKGVAA